MKAILKYKLPEEQEEFNTATKGADWQSICHELHIYLRELRKNETKTIEVQHLISWLADEMQDHGLTIW